MSLAPRGPIPDHDVIAPVWGRSASVDVERGDRAVGQVESDPDVARSGADSRCRCSLVAARRQLIDGDHSIDPGEVSYRVGAHDVQCAHGGWCEDLPGQTPDGEIGRAHV